MIFPRCWPVWWYGSLPARAPVTAPIAVAAGCGGANSPIPKPDVAEPSAVLADDMVDLLHRPVSVEVFAQDHLAMPVAAAGRLFRQRISTVLLQAGPSCCESACAA